MENRIKELEETVRTLRLSSRKCEFFIHAVPDIVYQLDEQGNFAFINDTIERYGYKANELTGKNIIDIVHPEDRDIARYRINERRTGKRGTRDIEVRFLTADNDSLNVEIRENEMWDNPVLTISAEGLYSTDKPGEAGFIGTIGIARDITERVKFEAQYQQAQKMESIGRLAGGIAHDFNNLLTVITVTSEMMLMDLAPDSQMSANVNEIKDTAERAASLTRQLLTFSRKQIVETKVLNINDILFRMDKMLRRLIGEDIELVFIPGRDLWPVKADPGQMEQVLTNLVVNARDAMRKGGTLTIETSNAHLDDHYAETHPDVTPGDYIMMTVSDTGIGMDENTKSKVFEPFFTTKDKGRGTGLGLSTCYGIVKQNGGNIRVYSEPGAGSTFEVCLPRTYGNRGETRKSTGEDLPGGTETILVAEDEPAVKKMIKRILTGRGYTVIEASHGDEAVTVATEYKKPIHLLLTDIIMPHMGGKEAAKIIQSIHNEINILFISGYTDDSIVHQGVLDPGVAFLQKPFTPQSLLKKIRDVLDN